MLGQFIGGGRGAIELLGAATRNVSPATSASVSGAALGAAYPDRQILVAVAAQINGDISGVTVGGQACSLVVSQGFGSNTKQVSIWKVDAGAASALANATAADIVVSATAGILGEIIWFRVTDAPNTHATGQASGGAVASLALAVEVPALGVLLALFSTSTSGGDTGWTNATEQTDVNQGFFRVATATRADDNTITPNVTAARASGSGTCVMVSASFGY